MSEKKFHVGEVHTLKIERLAIGGRGVGRLDGLVVFVSDTAPSELVEVELTLVKKNFAEAVLVRVLDASPERVKPECQYFGTCGGCSWQHVSYQEQLLQKRNFVLDSARKFSKFEIQDSTVPATAPSPTEWRYRNRIQLHHRTSGNGAGLLGFHARSSHQLVDIKDCLITETALTERLDHLRKTLRNAPAGRVEIYTSEDGEVQTRDTHSDTQMSDSSEQKQNRNAPRARAGSSSKDSRKGLPPQKVASIAQPPPFSQVNTLQNKNLIDHCIALISKHSMPSENPRLFDLYSGHGNFTFPIANAFPAAQITAVELNAASVKLGYKLSKAKRLAHRVKFIASDVAEFLRRPESKSDENANSESETDAPIILIDPPRAGCDVDVMRALAEMRPQLIVYVSCHPVTLARDLGAFFEFTANKKVRSHAPSTSSQDLGVSDYELLQITPFDMFPQTDHVESVAVLRRKSELEKL